MNEEIILSNFSGRECKLVSCKDKIFLVTRWITNASVMANK